MIKIAFIIMAMTAYPQLGYASAEDECMQKYVLKADNETAAQIIANACRTMSASKPISCTTKLDEFVKANPEMIYLSKESQIKHIHQTYYKDIDFELIKRKSTECTEQVKWESDKKWASCVLSRMPKVKTNQAAYVISNSCKK